MIKHWDHIQSYSYFTQTSATPGQMCSQTVLLRLQCWNFSNCAANTNIVLVNENRREFMIIAQRKLWFSSCHKYCLAAWARVQTACVFLIFHSLGNIHRLVLRGLQAAGMPKRKVKVSSHHIWKMWWHKTVPSSSLHHLLLTLKLWYGHTRHWHSKIHPYVFVKYVALEDWSRSYILQSWQQAKH